MLNPFRIAGFQCESRHHCVGQWGCPNGANILTVLKFHDNELASVTVLSISMVLGTVEDMFVKLPVFTSDSFNSDMANALYVNQLSVS
jgi:hypothetical protein